MKSSAVVKKARARLGGTALLLLAGVLIPLVLLSVSAWRDYQTRNAQARSQLEVQSQFLHQYALSLFTTHEVIAENVISRAQGMSWDEIHESRELHDYLVHMAERFPEVHSIWLSDATGISRASSVIYPAPPDDISDREYYKLLKSTSDPIVVTKPFMPRRGPKEPVFTLGFRINRPDGTFFGFVTTVMSIKYFERAFATAATPGETDTTYGLLRADGEIIVRSPPVPAGGPTTFASDKRFMAYLNGGAKGFYEGASIITGSQRLASHHKIGSLPLFIGKSITAETVWSAWITGFRSYGLFIASAGLALLLLALYAARQHTRLLRTAYQLDEQVKQRTQHLDQALSEKTALFREVHHRTKNNLQIVASLARLQSTSSDKDALTRRIQAMAMVHELLYSKPEAAHIDLHEYIHKLCSALQEGVGQGTECKIEAAHVRIELERAVPFALILSEVLTNAFKYGKPASGSPVVTVSLQQTGPDLVLEARDNGKGMESGESQGTGFGMRLIKSLAIQLEGSFELVNAEGMLFRLRFPAARAH